MVTNRRLSAAAGCPTPVASRITRPRVVTGRGGRHVRKGDPASVAGVLDALEGNAELPEQLTACPELRAEGGPRLGPPPGGGRDVPLRGELRQLVEERGHEAGKT